MVVVDLCLINDHKLREPLSILIKYKTIDTPSPKIESILKNLFRRHHQEMNDDDITYVQVYIVK